MIKHMIMASALTFVTPAFAQTVQSAASQKSVYDLALEAVKVSYPSVTARAESVRVSEQSFRKSFGSDPQNAALEKRFPGLTNAMAAALRAEMARALLEIEPQVLGSVAADLAARLSASDLQETIVFYQSPAGQALLALDPKLMDRQTGIVSISSLSVADRQAIGRYQSSDAGQRTAAAMQQSLALAPQAAARLYAPLRDRVSDKAASAANAYIKRPSKR